MKETRAAKRGLSLRTKLIIAAVLLVVASFAVLCAFAAGFVTGSMVARNGQRDACAGAGGNWDEQAGLCMTQEVRQQPATPDAAQAYRCGDGTGFLLQPIDQDRVSYQDASSTPRELRNLDPAGAITRYGDGTLTVTVVGPEARLQDGATGRDISCAL